MQSNLGTRWILSSLDLLSEFYEFIDNFWEIFLFSLPPLHHFIFVTLHELDASPNFPLQY